MKEYRHYIHQVGTIKTLLEGHHESEVTIAELLRYGDYGFGTLNHTDGDFVIIDGQPVHMNQYGEHHGLNGQEKVPYGAVVQFRPQHDFVVKQVEHVDIFQHIKERLINTQLFSMTKLTGDFNYIHLSVYSKNHSPHTLKRPFHIPQTERAVRQIKGTILILYTPHDFTGIHPPGFSAYFVSEYHELVGKVLSFKVSNAVAQLQNLDGYTMICPAAEPLFIRHLSL
ncbi:MULTISPECIES: acetolactate decarboxylase [Staphylococcus]|uniref:Alpha-acetolactate decarboxylase n=1 Tax=Staphylococcus coagulans TaxID=74706 RepID=A0A9X0PHJ5_9STAP|nr:MULTISPECIES: acetolactate decarboxylase [Staphylococcus]NHA36577.1 alpha-acetolactate decarboxylase [Staphylococcus schleiferi]MBA8772757.1 acetolactate decarboxylase [Staphylococcus coagulans]MBA8776987.1 acetolactate decarboxylase [Staphylococcus coagulans]MBA8779810.1 acetolactate decarboxylase [Staphylococcus coagulans]NHB72217.1 alpha-acetolactate decarboxylase [Staphylococcus sp. 191]